MKRLYNIHQVEMKEREKKQATHGHHCATSPSSFARETIKEGKTREE